MTLTTDMPKHTPYTRKAAPYHMLISLSDAGSASAWDHTREGRRLLELAGGHSSC